MSVIVTATLEDQSFQVEVTRGGNLIFLDHDINYDLSMFEFGEGATTATRLLDEWREEPYEVICRIFGLDKKHLALLAADWVEHVLPLFEKEYPGYQRPRSAIIAAREYIRGNMKLQQLEVARHAASAWVPAQYAATTARAARISRHAVAAEAAEAAWTASQWAGSQKEVSWQIRRFIDITKALQSGMPWPPLEATK